MDAETLAYAVPFSGAIIGMIIMIYGIFQGGLTGIAIVGGLIAFVSIMATVRAGARVA